MNWSGLFKFLTGFTLAIALLFFAGVSATRYMIARFTTPPPKPVFPNDTPSAATPALSASPKAKVPSATPATTPATAATPIQASISPTPTPSPGQVNASPIPTVSPTVSPSPLESGAYEAKVSQPIGLIVRQDPSADAAQIGGVDYNQKVIVLGTSPDGNWMRVRLADGGLEGWVKAGNVEQAN
jgi:hypothetical protein